MSKVNLLSQSALKSFNELATEGQRKKLCKSMSSLLNDMAQFEKINKMLLLQTEIIYNRAMVIERMHDGIINKKTLIKYLS